MGRKIPILVVLLGSLLIGTGAAGPRSKPTRSPFVVGEKLVYDARVWKGLTFLGLSVGEATLEVRKSDREEWPDAYLFYARAEGGALGYTAVATVRSYLDPTTLRPQHFSIVQRGSETHDKQMLFTGQEALYIKKKHCKARRTCANLKHFVRKKKSRGLFAGYDTVRLHCPDKWCGNRNHMEWRIRDQHPLDGPTFDMLSVVYMCRTMDLPLKGKGEDIRVVSGHDLWDVTVRAVGKEVVEVPAGKFRCVRIQISPKPAADGTELKKEFQGLFGIRGNIQIWVDQETRIPVKIRGVVPFGVDLNMEVSLTKKRLRRSSGRRPGA